MTRLFFNEYFERKVERLAERQDENLFTLEKTDVNNFEFISVNEHLEIIKKRDTVIDLYLNAFKTADELRISSAERYDKEIQKRDDWECNHCFEKQELGDQLAKRDQLIEQAELFVHASINGGAQGEHFNKCEEWLKQYEELKR